MKAILDRYKRRWPFIAVTAGLLAATVVIAAQSKRSFEVSGRRYTFTVTGSEQAEIRVPVGSLVRITFSAEDIAHSFTTLPPDTHYRINRRAEPGKPVTFEFRADRAGRFPFGCTLTIDERCSREMRGVLIVE
jgi:heme/copper-type cytochrome/quinol oxidase subunit 2